MVATPHAITGILIVTLLERLRLAKWKKRQHLNSRLPHSKHLVNMHWPWLATISGACLLSHFLLDSIPHSDYSISDNDVLAAHRMGIDLFFSLFSFTLVFWRHIKTSFEGLRYPIGDLPRPEVKEKFRHLPLLALIFCGIFFAWLPDLIAIVFNGSQNYLFANFRATHHWAHSSWTPPSPVGWFIQILVCIIGVLLAKWQIDILEAQHKIESAAQQIGEEFDLRFTLKK